MSSADADALCTQCGICCDGTLYGSVRIAEPEVARLQRVGLTVVQNGEASMRQPCSALHDCLCSVYADRPSTCADYGCALRKSVSAGEPLQQAQANVTRMHQLLAVIREGFGCAPSDSIWEQILALDTPATPEAEAAALLQHGAAIEAVGELLQLARAAFEPLFAGAGRR